MDAEPAEQNKVSGRFDMICLHAFLVFDRLGQGPSETAAFSQAVYDELFMDMDRSLREMGVGDLAVGKRIRKMAEVLHGRSEAYRQALAEDADSRANSLEPVLARNIFDDVDAGGATLLAQYVTACHAALADQANDAIMAADIAFTATGDSQQVSGQ